MKHLSTVLFGATLAATTAAAVAFAPSSAMAVQIQLFGDVSVRGDANLGPNNATPATTAVTWTNNPTPNGGRGTVSTGSNGSFAGLVGNNVFLKNIALTIANLANVSPIAPSSATYNFGAINNFIDFGTVNNLPVLANGLASTASGNLTFDLDAGSLVRTALGNGVIEVTLNPVTGRFNFNGVTVATALLSGQQIGNSGNFGISITSQPEPIPEPLTMGGLALGAGFGAYLKSRYSKKDEQLEKV